jgi:hypothetical protein
MGAQRTVSITSVEMHGTNGRSMIGDKSPYRELRLLPTMHFSGAFDLPPDIRTLLNMI